MRGWAWFVAVAMLGGCGRVDYDRLPSDGGLDGGRGDAGPMDGGPPVDGGPVDGGRVDGGAPDGGLDSGVDGGGCETLSALESSLLGHYELDGDATDALGANDGVERGSPSYAAGRFDRAVDLDGVDDVIELPPLGNGGVAFSVLFWVRTTFVGPGPSSGGQWYQGASLVDAEMCGSPVGSDWGLGLVGGGYVVTSASYSTTQINDGEWHHVAYTRGAPVDSCVVYIDGVPEITIPRSAPASTHETVTFYGLGNSPCPSNYFRGQIDDVRIYAGELTQEDIDTVLRCL